MHNIIKCLDEIETIPEFKSKKYLYNGKSVPRVTEILSKMIHEETLMNWANSLGLNKRIKLKNELDKACDIGTYSHNNIEKYIKQRIYNKEELRNTVSNNDIVNAVDSAVESFKLWYRDILYNRVKIIDIEKPLICQWFGGTCDLLISINEKIYLVDFKTSNYVTYKYFLQLAAYNYILKLQNINISGCIILQLDKEEPSFEEYFLNFDNIYHKQFIDQCEMTFFSLVYGYYNILNTSNMYDNIFGE